MEEVPQTGERIVKIEKGKKEAANQGKSYLNESRLREHEITMARNPQFEKNKRRFAGLNSVATRSDGGPKSMANKLDAFIAK